MAENGNIYNNNNLNNFNNIETREFINRATSSTILTTSNTSSSGTIATTILEQGLSERDATHFRLRNGIIQDSEFITCISCGESFKYSSLLDIYDHFRERPHLRYYSHCLYCQGKVHQYYHNREHHIKYYHNCLRWKRGEDH